MFIIIQGGPHLQGIYRKDVRNAVEAAHKAAPGWGKRAAHNRFDFCILVWVKRYSDIAVEIKMNTRRN